MSMLKPFAFSTDPTPALAGALEAAGVQAALRASSDPSPTLHGLLGDALIDPLYEFVSRPGKQLRGQLVELLYLLAGGQPGALPPELPLLIEALHAGSLIVDDIEDGSLMRRGAPTLHRLCGLPRALNAGNYLYFLAQSQLLSARLSDTDRLLAFARVTECLVRCHEGQALDLYASAAELPQTELPAVVRAISALKTGSLIALAAELAAISAGAAPHVRSAFARAGLGLGVGLQMLDDLSGAVNPRKRDKAREDLQLGRPTWLWAFLAQDLAPDAFSERQRALSAAMDGADPEALLEYLRFRCEVVGRARARRQLDEAMAELRQVLPRGPALDALARKVDELEAAYVSG